MKEDPQCQILRSEIGDLRGESSERLAKFQEKSREVIANDAKVKQLAVTLQQKQNDVSTLSGYLARVRADAEQHPTDFGKTQLLGQVEARYNAAVAERGALEQEKNNAQLYLNAILERMNALSQEYQSSITSLNSRLSEFRQRNCQGAP